MVPQAKDVVRLFFVVDLGSSIGLCVDTDLCYTGLCYRDDGCGGPLIKNASSTFMFNDRAVQQEQPTTVVTVLVGLRPVRWQGVATRHRVADRKG
jgi:hypothetical protein